MLARLGRAAAALLLLSCSADKRAPAPRVTPAAATRSTPGPAPQTRAAGYDAVSENERCARCHAEIAAEWKGSQHRSAWDDEVFLAAFAVEPVAFCRRCHAPEVDDLRDGPDPARHVGVGCVTCHVLVSDVLGTRHFPGSGDGHPVTAEPRLAEAAWCGGCHHFAFPEPQDAPMQGTLAEHRASRFRDQSCQDCHMPLVGAGPGAHRDHAFRVQGDAAMLRSSIAAEARRAGPRSIVVSMRVTAAGHAVPTGDLYRRIEVRAQVEDDEARPVVLARAFARRDGAHGPRRVQTGDTRLAASGEPSEIEVFFTRRIEAQAVQWQVVYQRMGPHEAMLFGVDLPSEETLLASGVIASDIPEPGAAP